MLGLDLSGISRGELSATSEVQTLDSSRISAALALRVSIKNRCS